MEQNGEWGGTPNQPPVALPWDRAPVVHRAAQTGRYHEKHEERLVWLTPTRIYTRLPSARCKSPGPGRAGPLCPADPEPPHPGSEFLTHLSPPPDPAAGSPIRFYLPSPAEHRCRPGGDRRGPWGEGARAPEEEEKERGPLRRRRRSAGPSAPPEAGSRAGPTSLAAAKAHGHHRCFSRPGRAEAGGRRQHRPGAGLTCGAGGRPAGGGARPRAALWPLSPQARGGRAGTGPRWVKWRRRGAGGGLRGGRGSSGERKRGSRRRPRPFGFVSRGCFAAGEGERRPGRVRGWGGTAPARGPLPTPQACWVTEGGGNKTRCNSKIWKLISFYCLFIV